MFSSHLMLFPNSHGVGGCLSKIKNKSHFAFFNRFMLFANMLELRNKFRNTIVSGGEGYFCQQFFFIMFFRVNK